MEQVKIEVLAVDAASSVLSGIGGAGIALGVALVAGLAAATAAMADFVNTAAEAEEVQVKFDTLVGNSNLADYTGEMHALADSLSQVTRFDDETILSAEGMLATFDTIGKEIFPRVTQSALDLAEATGQDASSAAATLGRAFADIAGGSLGALRGVAKLTDAQKETATAMAKAGDSAGAEAYVLDVLDGKFGGLAQKMGGTFNGQMKIFQNTIDNLKEDLGNRLLPILTPLIGKFTELALQVMPMLGGIIDTYVVPIVNILTYALSEFIEAVLSGEEPIASFLDILSEITGIDFNRFAAPLVGMADGLVSFFQNAVAGVGKFIEDGWAGIVEFAQGIMPKIQPGLDAFRKFWEDNSPAIQSIVQGTFAKLTTIFSDLGAKILPWLVQKFNELGAWFQTNGPLIDKFVAVMGDQFVQFSQHIADMWMIAQPILDNLFTLIGNIAVLIMQVATGDWKGAWETMQKTIKDWWVSIQAVLSGLWNFILTFFNTNSTKLAAAWAVIWNGLLSKAQEIWKNIQIAIAVKTVEIALGITQFITGLVTSFSDAIGDFEEVGAGIVDGIQAGITSAWDSFVAWLISQVAALPATILSIITGGGSGTSLSIPVSLAPTNVQPQNNTPGQQGAFQQPGNGRVTNNFFGPITLQLASDSDFLKVR